MNKTKIEWTDFTANPVKYRDADGKSVWACVKASDGCKNCYAEALAKRYGRGGPFTVGQMAKVEPYLDEAELKGLLSVKRLPPGSKVFVGDMTDIFGPWVTDEMLDRMFAVFALRPDVTFQLLTKRPERMRAYLERWLNEVPPFIVGFCAEVTDKDEWDSPWPLPNVWLGTSVEDQQRADERIPELLACPAALRYISLEPMLGPVDITEVRAADGYEYLPLTGMSAPEPRIHWVIVGGEFGPGARPCDVGWVRSIVAQCQAAGTAVFVKQLGAKPYVDAGSALRAAGLHVDTTPSVLWTRLRNRKGGDMGEWPADLRVREVPR